MSEKKPFDTENIAEEIKEAAEKTAKPKAKKRKKGRISVQLTAILLIIALLFGAVLGFALGRSRQSEAEATIRALNERIAELEDSWATDLTDENIDALSLLAGESIDEESFTGDDEAPLGYQEDALDAAVVAEFKGGQLMSNEVASAYNDRVAGYIFSGYTEDEIPEELLTDLLEEMAGQKILMSKAQEMGVYELTDADKAEIAAEAEATISELVDMYRGFMDDGSRDEAAAIEATKAYLAENEGISYDSVYAMLSESWWMEKLYNEITKDVKIESADIIELYNEKLEDQKAAFSEFPEDFEATQMSGETIVYNLEGYRAVKLLSLSPDDAGAADTAAIIEEEIALLDPESDSESIARYQAELNAIYAPAEEKMQAVIQQINSGADFDEMLAKYGEDIGMQTDELRKTGYYVSRNSLLWPDQMISAAYALNNPGDISAPLRMNGSICILKYVGEVTPGAVSIDEMYDSISAEVLDYARAQAYEIQIAKWMEEAQIKYYPERMR